MSKEGVNLLIARMISEPRFKSAVMRDPTRTINRSGFDISPQELRAIKKLTPSDLKVQRRRRRIGPGDVASECCLSGVKSF